MSKDEGIWKLRSKEEIYKIMKQRYKQVAKYIISGVM
jgi:hypothetical protein